MKRYAITPSFGFSQCAPRVYVAAATPQAATQAAQLVTGKVNGFKPTHWPVALVSHFPASANVINALS